MQLSTITNPTMSSREIAELLESRHDNVKLSMERLAANGVISFTSSQETSHEGSGARPVLVYLVNKRDSYVVVAQMSPKFTGALVDRWQELESKQSAPALDNPKVLREMLLSYTEKVIALEQKVANDAPKVEFAEAVRRMQGACHIGDFAKTIAIGRNTFFKMLRSDGILMANNLPYQKYIDDERFVVIEQVPYTNSKGITVPAFTPMLTGKGQVWLEKKYRAYIQAWKVA